MSTWHRVVAYCVLCVYIYNDLGIIFQCVELITKPAKSFCLVRNVQYMTVLESYTY
jgi:hypothetical protein